MPPTRYVVITGSSTGIGRACVLHLARRGWSVFAGVRKAADAEALRTGADGADNILPLIIDVTDGASIQAAAGQVSETTGAQGLAALVNNAGISVNGPLELVPIADWRRQFEVNFFGHIAVTQTMLPLLRTYADATEGRQPARIVMMSSIAGRLGQPILGPYCSSKFALEAASDALRVELRAQRIGVSVVEPGAIRSEIWRKALDEAAQEPPDPRAEQYQDLIRGVTAAATKAEQMSIPALRVAQVVERCLTARRAPIRVLVGADAKLGATAVAFLPTRLMDAILSIAIRRAGRKR
jgi:NAD(P)-dependent dehydrogenase (short-subunit alcohol dehydrogenase family)